MSIRNERNNLHLYQKASISKPTLENWYFDDDSCKVKLKEHFHVNMLDGLESRIIR
ncbi:MAG: hypothetical protein ACLS9K_06435 [Lachnospira eligens]